MEKEATWKVRVSGVKGDPDLWFENTYSSREQAEYALDYFQKFGLEAEIV